MLELVNGPLNVLPVRLWRRPELGDDRLVFPELVFPQAEQAWCKETGQETANTYCFRKSNFSKAMVGFVN